jgi:hypothetical protein
LAPQIKIIKIQIPEIAKKAQEVGVSTKKLGSLPSGGRKSFFLAS